MFKEQLNSYLDPSLLIITLSHTGITGCKVLNYCTSDFSFLPFFLFYFYFQVFFTLLLENIFGILILAISSILITQNLLYIDKHTYMHVHGAKT